MRISDLYGQKKTVVSFEVFPPKSDVPLDTIFNTIDGLKHLDPHFISVTYGAGGGTRSRTLEISSHIKNFYNIEALSHLTCVNSTFEEVDNILRSMQNERVENILALRGDMPNDAPSYSFSNQDFRYASDLISYIKNFGDFCIGAACYPEGHIQAPNRKTDIQNLKLKVDAGVDFLTTQLFFDNSFFYSFINDIRTAGIACPVSAGIMPVCSTKLIKKITVMCGASIPRKLASILNKYEHNPEDLSKAGAEYATVQIKDLINHGVEGIHLYSMNRIDQMQKIIGALHL